MKKKKKKICKYASKTQDAITGEDVFFCLDTLPPGRVYEYCRHDCFNHKGK